MVNSHGCLALMLVGLPRFMTQSQFFDRIEIFHDRTWVGLLVWLRNSRAAASAEHLYTVRHSCLHG